MTILISDKTDFKAKKIIRVIKICYNDKIINPLKCFY